MKTKQITNREASPIEEDFSLLKMLYSIHSKSHQEKPMIDFLLGWITKNVPETEVTIDTYGNMYITKGLAEIYPCLVAHLDQVQTYHPEDFAVIETDEYFFGISPADHRQAGLGADDKNGIWIALKCLSEFDQLKVAFFVGEETGCYGSSFCDMKFFDNCRFVIEPDRRGNKDLIKEIGWSPMCSKKFLKAIKPGRFGYNPKSGLMTDIEELKSRGLGVSCVNLSCGYYNPHTDQEYTVKHDLIRCLDYIRWIIKNCKKTYKHKTEEDSDFLPGLGTYDWWEDNNAYDEVFSLLDSDPTMTVSDLYTAIHKDFPKVTKDEIAFWVDDYELFKGGNY